jgi:hypothetical protein
MIPPALTCPEDVGGILWNPASKSALCRPFVMELAGLEPATSLGAIQMRHSRQVTATPRKSCNVCRHFPGSLRPTPRAARPRESELPGTNQAQPPSRGGDTLSGIDGHDPAARQAGILTRLELGDSRRAARLLAAAHDADDAGALGYAIRATTVAACHGRHWGTPQQASYSS